MKGKEMGQIYTHCAFGAVDRINTVALLKHPFNDPCVFFLLEHSEVDFIMFCQIIQRALITGMG